MSPISDRLLMPHESVYIVVTFQITDVDNDDGGACGGIV